MKVKLGDIFEIGSGGTPSKSHPEYYGGDIPWVKTGDLKSEYLYEVEDFITEEGLKNSSAKLYEPDTVLIAMYGATIGATSILKMDACINQACAAFKKNDKVIPEYLYYFLKSQKVKFVKDGVGGAQPNISAGYLKKVEMELPSLDEQRAIVEVLDKTTNIMVMRNQEIASLDNLIKARFVEMFGDMNLNSKGWPEAKLESMADVVSGITKGRKTKAEDLTEVPYMAVSNVKDGYIDWTTVKTIEATQQEIEQYRLLADDVLMTEGGDPDKVGRGAIIKEPLENCIHQNHIFRVRLDESMILPEFFAEYLQHQRSKRYFLGCAKQTTGIASINMTQLRALPVLMPPLSKQEEFVLFKAQVDKSKVAVQKALDETQLLFDSLMQEYFG